MLLPATSQTKESLSNLPFEAIRDSINTYLYTNTEKSLTAAKAYVLKAQQENDAENEWLGMESIALNHITARDYKNANEVAVQLLEFARINNLDKLEMRSLAFLGDLQLVVTSSEEQLRYYNELLALAEARENDEYREAALNKIANIMDLSGATEKGRCHP